METWQLQEAKNKFSELVEHALHGKPQLVTRHGKPAVIIISAEDYEKTKKTGDKDFIEFLLHLPKLPGKSAPFKRIKSRMRNIDL